MAELGQTLKTNCGVYEIVNLVTGQRYIGHSKWIEFRWYCHRRDLVNGWHHNVYLQRAWDKYGPDSFKFRVIELCVESDLLRIEQGYLDRFWDDPDALYNVARQANQPAVYPGRAFSEEHKQKISRALTGKPKSPEHTKKNSRSHRGKTRPSRDQETKEKISRANKGSKRTEEQRKMMGQCKIFLRALRRIFD